MKKDRQLVYSGKCSQLTFYQLWNFTSLAQYYPIISELESQTGKRYLRKSSKIISVKRYYGFRVKTKVTTGILTVYKHQKSGDSMIEGNGPSNIFDYSYKELKDLYNGWCTRINSSIHTHSCSKTEMCPKCKGSGICVECCGNKIVDCPVCSSSKSCPSCSGTGLFECNRCDGSGECNECNGSGTETCNNCSGFGSFVCRTCDGSNSCPDCNGSGEYYTGRKYVVCRRCKGSRICRTCDGGNRRFECKSCNGTGVFPCSGCNGSGDCLVCGSNGGVYCKACRGSGICGKCRGKEKISCPECRSSGKCGCYNGVVECIRCKGTGVYQSFITYEIDEKHNSEFFLSINCNKNVAKDILGVSKFKGNIFERFHQSIISKKINEVNNVTDGKNVFSVSMNEGGIGLGEYLVAAMSPEKGDYVKVDAEIDSFPITEITLLSRDMEYSIFVIGNNSIICYNQLPSFFSRLIGAL